VYCHSFEIPVKFFLKIMVFIIDV